MTKVLRAFRPNEARFIRPACYRFTNRQIIEMMTSRGLRVYTRPDGRVFPVDQTAKDVVATCLDVARRIKKVAVVVGVCPGFVGNRMLFQRGIEANRLILEGATPWQVDLVLYDFGLPMGPFAMSDLAGLDIGWNVNCAYFIYGYLQEILPVVAVDAPRTWAVTVAGHINEASDVFSEDYPMPVVEEGDIVALLNAGGYDQAMSSTHCLRPMAEAVFLDR